MTRTNHRSATRKKPTTDAALSDIGARLRRDVAGEVQTDAQARALFSTDASVYRHVPLAVVTPRDRDDVIAAVAACRELGVPLLPRGGGTSIAGQACNEAVILDTSQHLRRILDLDPEARTAVVEPGVVLDDLRAAAAPYGLTFGPDPSTHSRCTLGGMIGNNACGTHSIAWGKTVDNVTELEVLLYDGTRLTARDHTAESISAAIGRSDRSGVLVRDLIGLRDTFLEELRTGFPDLPRRVSGFNLDELLPERGFHLARALVGTEGTCATTLTATLRLVDAPAARALLVLGYVDLAGAGDHVPRVLGHQPLGLEGIGRALMSALGRHRSRATDLLPPGDAWLLAEFGSATPAEARRLAAAAQHDLATDGVLAGSAVVTSPRAIREIWQIREQGAGLASRLANGAEAWAGWEDAAVPPARLGAYLRDFDRLLAAHGRAGVPYGHFGDGCIHVRIDFDLLSKIGVAGYRRFLEDAADLVVSHGGSLSGEHGDGQMRAELLGRMYSPTMLHAFNAFKSAFDPENRMNPGRVVYPRPLDADIRFLPTPQRLTVQTAFTYPDDGGDFAAAARRCVGVGLCRRSDGDVMCPSFMATGQEKNSTRGRARLLFEMLRGDLITDGWRSEEVRDALDLCLGCKGCRSDCPVQVDMATYKVEFLAHHFAGRLRPRAHYSMGWAPLWLRFAACTPGLVNRLSTGPVAPILKHLGGVDQRRELPPVATQTLRTRLRLRSAGAPSAGPRVLLWPDTFTNYLQPRVGEAAVDVLADAGFAVEVPGGQLCCGLPWISTGQLRVAQAVARHSARRVRAQVRDGMPVTVLEPSCAAALRVDLPELLPDDPDVRALGAAVRTFAETLTQHAPDWPPPRVYGHGLVQTHCHQHAVLGRDADDQLLDAALESREMLDSGCCGLAGNFGFEQGHYDVSMACAERRLLPAVRADGDAYVLADGFSCRTQIHHGSGRQALHLAELLRIGLQQRGVATRPPPTTTTEGHPPIDT